MRCQELTKFGLGIKRSRGASGEEIKKWPYDHYHMLVEFEIFFDLNMVSLMHLGLFLIYKCFTNKRSSNGGLW
jgi:hypothetical protein